MALPQKTIRCLILDPIFPGGSPHAGQRWSAVYPDGYVPYYTRVQLAQAWLDKLNTISLGEQVYSFYTGAPEIVDYVPCDAWGTRLSVNDLEQNQIVHPRNYPDDAAHSWYGTPGNRPMYAFGDSTHGGGASILDVVSHFGLVDQINSGAVDDVWFAPIGWRAGPEAIMLAPPDDQGAFRAHEGPVRVPGLTRRCGFVSCSGNIGHHYLHRIGAQLAAISGWPNASDERFVNEEYEAQDRLDGPWGREDVNQNSIFGWFMSPDIYDPANGGAGQAHATANARENYDQIDERQVLSNAGMFKDLSQFPLDLSRNDRLQPLTAASFDPGVDVLNPEDQMQLLTAQAAVLGMMPRQAGEWNGYWADWRKYLIDLNDEHGRKSSFADNQFPYIPPRSGGRDGRLTLRYGENGAEAGVLTSVRLSWRRQWAESPFIDQPHRTFGGQYHVYALVQGQPIQEILMDPTDPTNIRTPDQNTTLIPTLFWPDESQYALYAVAWAGADQVLKMSDVLGFIRRPSAQHGTTPPSVVEIELDQTMYPTIRVDEAPYPAGSLMGAVRWTPDAKVTGVIHNTWQQTKTGLVDQTLVAGGHAPVPGTYVVYDAQAWDAGLVQMLGVSDFMIARLGVSTV